MPNGLNRTIIMLSSGALAALAGVVWAQSQTGNQDFKPVRVVRPFPPLTSFPIKPAREAGDALNPSELVLGVTVNRESRAYPINMLTGPEREILNDTLGDLPIAATW